MSQGRVIRTFQQHREIEEKLQALAMEWQASAREALAQELAQYDDAAIAAILRHLKTKDPLLRAALGLVASHLPREKIVPALYRVVSDLQRTDQERVAALMILERFLDEVIEDSVYAELRNPEAVMEQSLSEVVENMDRVPEIVVDYIEQLEEEPVEVALTVLRLAEDFPGEDVFPVLVALAQGQRTEVAEAALHMLGKSPHPDALPTLLTLAEFLPASLQATAQRSARKLRMKGHLQRAYEPAPWRAFASAPDLNGSQAFWLMREGEDLALLISLLVNVDLGIQFAFLLREIPPEFIPSRHTGRPTSIPLDIALDEGERQVAWLFEVPVGHVRRWIRNLVSQNYANEYALPVMFRLHITRFWQETRDQGIAPPPELPQTTRLTYPDARTFFNHEAFALWSLAPSHTLFQEQDWARGYIPLPIFHEALRQLRAKDFPPTLWDKVAHRLLQVAEWFTVIGDERMAAYTVAVADIMRTVPYERNPYAQVLVERGVVEMIQHLRAIQEAQDREESPPDV